MRSERDPEPGSCIAARFWQLGEPGFTGPGCSNGLWEATNYRDGGSVILHDHSGCATTQLSAAVPALAADWTRLPAKPGRLLDCRQIERMVFAKDLDNSDQSMVSCSIEIAVLHDIENRTVHFRRVADGDLAGQRGNPRVRQTWDHQRTSRGRTGEPPRLLQMEPGGRRDRGGVVVARSSRIGRSGDDKIAHAAERPAYRSGGLLRSTSRDQLLRIRGAFSSTRKAGR